MAVRHSKRTRAAHNWYVEPPNCVDSLCDALPTITHLHDPCCGGGNIVDTALLRGINATGADIVDRANGRYPVRDFMRDDTVYENIVSNPPYLKTDEGPSFVRHALDHVVRGGLVVFLTKITFLASQTRYELLTAPECALVLVLSRRPSIPPGHVLATYGEAIRRNGSDDYCWIAWQHGRKDSPAHIRWLPP